MVKHLRIWVLFFCMLAVACVDILTSDLKEQKKTIKKEPEMNQFSQDVALLEKHFSAEVLAAGDSRIVVLPELQGRIMVSSSRGDDGESLGWINRSLLDSDKINPLLSVGGSDRLWFGPEIGPYSVFLPPGVEAVSENMRLQSAMSTQSYQVTEQGDRYMVMEADIELQNYNNFLFQAHVKRHIRLFSHPEIERELGIIIPENLSVVGFGSNTKIKNTSNKSWTSEQGLFSVWSLGMFPSGQGVTAFVPFQHTLTSATDYFNEGKPSHTRIVDQTLFYRVDGEFMNKVGIPLVNTLPIMGSYDRHKNLLTITTFSFPKDSNTPYVSSIWDSNRSPYDGEAINIFNDGPDADGNYFGHFYELESSSPALALNPGDIGSHSHHTFHIQGKPSDINSIVKLLFAITLNDIESAFK